MSEIKKLSASIIERAAEKQLTISTAESCTGGWIGKALTAIPGSSRVFLGGVISYDNSVKSGVLGVSQSVLDKSGAVSEPCAREMAQGVRTLIQSDIAVSVTGIAGPGGGSTDKPVGTVCFGLASKTSTEVITQHYGDIGRRNVRKQSVLTALKLLRQAVNCGD